jgi:hypothetical protein
MRSLDFAAVHVDVGIVVVIIIIIIIIIIIGVIVENATAASIKIFIRFS